jgi:hypothetical protein
MSLDAIPDLTAEANRLRQELHAMLADLDHTGPLPAPTNYVREGSRGAHWNTGISMCQHYDAGTVTILALAEDVRLADPCVYLQGTDCAFPTDMKALTREEARRLGRADMAGSELISQSCGQARPKKGAR